MSSNKVGFWCAHLFLLAYCAILIAGFALQFIGHELPCPLCMLQRMAMILVMLGPAYIISRARYGDVAMRDYTTGYGMSLIAAIAGMAMSSRQILLHVLPGDPGYGSPVMGLHPYTWALITFLTVIVFVGVSLVFADELLPGVISFGWVSKWTLGLAVLLIAANLGMIFFLEGFHWILPDNPTRYELIA
ncbi:hypothetical protein A5641_10380 [Mycobacterium sp. 1554424.7]|nr:hypothetical protein A5641_10380 [Mycobacterium sp. 1554424.7]